MTAEFLIEAMVGDPIGHEGAEDDDDAIPGDGKAGTGALIGDEMEARAIDREARGKRIAQEFAHPFS